MESNAVEFGVQYGTWDNRWMLAYSCPQHPNVEFSRLVPSFRELLRIKQRLVLEGCPHDCMFEDEAANRLIRWEREKSGEAHPTPKEISHKHGLGSPVVPDALK